MSAAPSDLATVVIEGENAARTFLIELSGGVVPPDRMHDYLRAVMAAGDSGRLRAFLRVIQKALERNRG